MKMLVTTMCIIWGIIFVVSAQTTYTDAVGDIDPSLSTAGGTADIVAMEVSHNTTDFMFKLTVNGDVNTIDWAKFMIGIATGSGSSTPTGNGWGRPINLDGTGSTDMNYWIGSWVDGGGGAQLWSYNGSSWSGPTALTVFSLTGGVTSTINITVSQASLGISTFPGSFYFDAYSSGGGGGDGALDALANPNVTISDWSGSYTSNQTNGLLNYSWTLLPVELTSFQAIAENTKVVLVWQTATETNNYGFEIERSTCVNKMRNWEKIGFVPGSGNSNSAKEYSFTDKNIYSPAYVYRLKQIDNDGKFEYSKETEADNLQPSTYELRQNYPNPFNPVTKIAYQIPEEGFVSLKVYDIMGNVVAALKNEVQQAGGYEVLFDASALSSGTYFYRIESGDFVATKKMVVLK